MEPDIDPPKKRFDFSDLGTLFGRLIVLILSVGLLMSAVAGVVKLGQVLWAWVH